MHCDFLIIGQGIAGTLLSYELMRLGKSVLVLDRPDIAQKSSLVAGAVLNPMAGKHWSPAPQAPLFIPAAVDTYRQLETLLHIPILKEVRLGVFHQSHEEAARFERQAAAFPGYFDLHTHAEDAFFSRPFGTGSINGVYLVNGPALLEAWRKKLRENDAFRAEVFEWDKLEITDGGIGYGSLTAGAVICCTGAEAAGLPYFSALPFTANRGEALIVSIPGLPEHTIFHRHFRLIPRGEGQFWLGSNYNWNFTDLLPDAGWRQEATFDLEQWLRLPFEVKDHIVAARPTTAGQFPFVGRHPRLQRLALFNGLGTRGFSAGPFWAAALAQHLSDPSYRIPHYDTERFQRFFK